MQIKVQAEGNPNPSMINFPDFLNPFFAIRAYCGGTEFDSETGLSVIKNVKIFDFTFSGMSSDAFTFVFKNVTFVDCQFIDCDTNLATFNDCRMIHCELIRTSGAILEVTQGVDATLCRDRPTVSLKTNDEIEREFKCKCKTLQNKKYVKCIFTCDFCHKDTVSIFHRNTVRSPFMDVPNCDRKVCRECYASYNLTDKFYGNRHYGYNGPVSRFTTPMDKTNTVILGLEMEFEGDFYGWKELQDAHKGYLHYGYDSSVDGQNELSWDCGSYSWWKYIAPLKEVCDSLKKYGGHAGDTAGIHIHASVRDKSMRELARKINLKCRSGKWNALMKAVSMRSNLERFNRYADLTAEETQHHAGISYNGHGTVEFRIFNSSVDHIAILHMLKFVKETFEVFVNGRKKVIYSPESKSYIKKCADAQLAKGFITDEEHKTVLREFC